MKKYLKWFIMILCLFIFIFIAIRVYTNTDMIIDNLFYNFIKDYFINDNLTYYVNIITWFGSTIGIILICVLSLFIFKEKKINTSIICNLIIVTILNNLLKIIFMRARPDINPLVIENSFSFPSGHSMISMAFYGFLIYIIYTNKNNLIVKWVFIIFLSILIVLIGISRVYLGVHYTSDVIGGFCFSISYLIIYIYFYRKITDNN